MSPFGVGLAIGSQLLHLASTPHIRKRMQTTVLKLMADKYTTIPVFLSDPKLPQEMAAQWNEKGIYVASFNFPIVSRTQDRIRIQLSATYGCQQLERAIDACVVAGNQKEIVE